MILSRKHRYIFLHCRKTAGSSLAVSLARDLGPEDLQISAIPETVAANIPLTQRVLKEANRHAHGLLPLFRLLGPGVHARLVTRSIDHADRPTLGRKPPHAPAAKVAAAFPDDWRDSTKFCVVRNPWDKTVSDYFWRIKGVSNPPTFRDYVLALDRGDSLNGIVPLEFHSNWEFYTIENRIVADHIIRYENLLPDLERTFRTIGLKWDGWLPRAKSGTRGTNARASYRDAYDDQTRAIVSRLYALETEAFGYSF